MSTASSAVAELDRQGRQRDDRGHDTLDVSRRTAAIAVQQPPDRQPVQDPAATAADTGGRATARSSTSSIRTPPAATRTSGPEQWVAHDAERELHAAAGHRRHRHRRTEPRCQFGVARSHRIVAGQIEQHAADVGLVRDGGVVGLQDHRPHRSPTDRPGRRHGLGGARDGRGRHDGQAVVREQRERRRRVQRPGREPGQPGPLPLGIDRGSGRRLRAGRSIAVRREMFQRQQAAASALQDGDAVGSQPLRLLEVHRGVHGRQQGQGHVRGVPDVLQRKGIRLVAVELGDQVDGQCDHSDAGVVGHGLK